MGRDPGEDEQDNAEEMKRALDSYYFRKYLASLEKKTDKTHRSPMKQGGHPTNFTSVLNDTEIS